MSPDSFGGRVSFVSLDKPKALSVLLLAQEAAVFAQKSAPDRASFLSSLPRDY